MTRTDWETITNSPVHNGRQRVMDIRSANSSLIGHHILWYMLTRMDSHLTTWQTSLNNYQSELLYIFLSFLRWLITSRREKNIIVETGNWNKSTASDWYKLNYQYYEQIQLYVLIIWLVLILCLRGVTLCCVPHTYR